MKSIEQRITRLEETIRINEANFPNKQKIIHFFERMKFENIPAFRKYVLNETGLKFQLSTRGDSEMEFYSTNIYKSNAEIVSLIKSTVLGESIRVAKSYGRTEVVYFSTKYKVCFFFENFKDKRCIIRFPSSLRDVVNEISYVENNYR